MRATSPDFATRRTFHLPALAKRSSLFILEAVIFEGDEPALIFNPSLDDPVFGLPTLWIPTASTLDGMLRLAAFDPLAVTDIPAGQGGGRELTRRTILCRAVLPRDVRDRSPLLADIHHKAKWTGRIDFRALERANWPASSIDYSGPEGTRPIDVLTEIPDVPLQPRWIVPASL